MKTLPLTTDPVLAVDGAIVAFHEAFRAVVSEADELLAASGLGRSHHKVLFHVARHSNCKTSEVQEFVGVSRQALQRPIAELHRLALIETLVSPENRRTHLLRLTPAGVDLEQKASALIQRHFSQVFTALGASHQASWLQVMRALAASVG